MFDHLIHRLNSLREPSFQQLLPCTLLLNPTQAALYKTVSIIISDSIYGDLQPSRRFGSSLPVADCDSVLPAGYSRLPSAVLGFEPCMNLKIRFFYNSRNLQRRFVLFSPTVRERERDTELSRARASWTGRGRSCQTVIRLSGGVLKYHLAAANISVSGNSSKRMRSVGCTGNANSHRLNNGDATMSLAQAV